MTQSTSIRKSDSELKTIGDLANRNRDRMSDDQKQTLTQKHNLYKNKEEKKQLPSGMTRLKKQHKTKWT
jgi:superfamily II RNA helicase